MLSRAMARSRSMMLFSGSGSLVLNGALQDAGSLHYLGALNLRGSLAYSGALSSCGSAKLFDRLPAVLVRCRHSAAP